jgi:O-antigen/teichoic acid export membrane protein
MPSIKRQLLLNGSATVIQKVILASRHLVIVPFFISSWGIQRYGEWLTLSAVPTALTLTNFGLATAASNSFVLAYGRGDLPGAARAMRSGIFLVSAVVLLGLLVGGLALFLFSSTGTLDHLSVPPATAISVILILGVGTLIGFFSPLNEAWFRAVRSNHKIIHFTSFSTVVTILILIGLLLAGKGLIWIAGAQLGVTIITVIALHIHGSRLIPEVRTGNVAIDRQELKVFFKKGFAFMMSPTRQVINIQGTLFVTRIFLGAEAVAMLGTLRTIANSVAQLYNAISTAIYPELQLAIANSRAEDARRIYRFAIGISVSTGVVGCALLAVAGPTLYHIWTAGKLDPPALAWVLLIATIFFNSLWWTAATTFPASNQPERPAVVGIFAASIGVGVSALLLTPMGISGAIPGMLVMEVIMTLYILPASCAVLQQPLRRLPSDVWALRHAIFNQLPWRKGGKQATGPSANP